MVVICDLVLIMLIIFVVILVDVVVKIDSLVYYVVSIFVGIYDGQEQDVLMVVIDNILVSYFGVSDELVYQMIKLMFDNLLCLVIVYVVVKDIVLDKVVKNLLILLYFGVECFYKEKGVLFE